MGAPFRSPVTGEEDGLRVALLVGAGLEPAARVLAADRDDLQAGGARERRDRGKRVVPVAPGGARAPPQAVGAAAQHVHGDLGAAAGLAQAGGAAVPEHDPPAVLDDPIADVAVGRQRVDVERQQPVRRHVRADRPQRALDVVRRRQVVERVVEAGDEVEAAVHRQLAHVGHVDVRLSSELAPRDRRHPRRAVTADDLVAELEQRREALAGAACDVERPPAAQPVLAGQAVDRPQPGTVGVPGGEEVVGRREHVVGARGR